MTQGHPEQNKAEESSPHFLPQPPANHEPRRLKIALSILAALLACAGAAAILLGLLAYQLGLDNDPGWGKGRVILVALGALSTLCAALILYRRTIARELSRAAENRFLRAARGVLHKNWRTFVDSKMIQTAIGWRRSAARRIAGFAPFAWLRGIFTGNGSAHGLLAATVVILVHLWYITAGAMTTWTPSSRYFDQLGQAFLSGSLALLEKPAPELLALADPFDWRARENIAHPWDVSLYNGRFFLYWGPAPAMLAALVKSVVDVTVEDQYLIFFFCSGLTLLLALTLALIRRRIFSAAPAWTVGLFTLTGGLSLPVLWLLTRPSVYEASIAGGQFFLIAGLYCALRACLREGPAHAGWLFAAGLAWGAAVACRLNLAPAVIFFSAVVAWRLIARSRTTAGIPRLLLFGLPLVVWAAGLAWYNYARFGSVLETGHRYQLTGPALPRDYRQVSSPAYILPNLYNYLLRPLAFDKNEFPPVSAPYIAESMWPRFIQPPENYYYSEPVAGLLTTVPAVMLGLLPLLTLASRFWDWLNERKPLPPASPAPPGSDLVWWLVAGGCVLTFAPLLIFISSTMRYLADVAPLAAVLAAMGTWWGLARCSARPGLRGVFILAALALAAAAIYFSLLANFANGDFRFEEINPALYARIAAFLTGDPR